MRVAENVWVTQWDVSRVVIGWIRRHRVATMALMVGLYLIVVGLGALWARSWMFPTSPARGAVLNAFVLGLLVLPAFVVLVRELWKDEAI
jgi:uncharacterized membrane protein